MGMLTASILLSIVFITNGMAQGSNSNTKVFDLRGEYVGTLKTAQPVTKIELRTIISQSAVSKDGKEIAIASGVYIVAPQEYVVAFNFQTGNSGLAFVDITDSYLPQINLRGSDADTADFNGDGLIDIVFSQYTAYCDTTQDIRPHIWIQKTDGRFIDETELRIPKIFAPTLDIELFDADNDNDIDIFLGGYSCIDYHLSAGLLINDGNGVFKDESSTRLPGAMDNGFAFFAAVGNVDNNESVDIVVNYFSDNIDTTTHQVIKPHIWLNDGSGLFFIDSLNRLTNTDDYGFFELLLADLDNDSLNDIILGNNTLLITGPGGPEPIDTLSGQLAYFKNIGDGFFKDETQARIPLETNRSTRCLAVADVDIDNDLDILDVGFYWDSKPQVRLFLNDGNGYFADTSQQLPPTLAGWFNQAKFGLINEDKYTDLFMVKVLPGENSYDVLLINNRGAGFIDSSGLLPARFDFSVASVLTDHDNDNDIDIFTLNTHGQSGLGGQNALYRNLLNDVSSVRTKENLTSEKIHLTFVYPNPANPQLEFLYAIPKSAYVQLNVYDVLGRETARLVDEFREAGMYKIQWSVSKLSSGIYFLRISADDVSEVKKVSILK
jgi:hypothetical protein